MASQSCRWTSAPLVCRLCLMWCYPCTSCQKKIYAWCVLSVTRFVSTWRSHACPCLKNENNAPRGSGCILARSQGLARPSPGHTPGCHACWGKEEGTGFGRGSQTLEAHRMGRAYTGHGRGQGYAMLVSLGWEQLRTSSEQKAGLRSGTEMAQKLSSVLHGRTVAEGFGSMRRCFSRSCWQFLLLQSYRLFFADSLLLYRLILTFSDSSLLQATYSLEEKKKRKT